MEAENIEVEESSLSDDLAAAWDAAEGEFDGEFSGVSEPESDTLEQSASGEGFGDRGEHDSPVDQAGIQGAAEGEVRQSQDEPQGDKPPVGLSAAAREVWDQTPPEIREEIAKRERDFAYQIQKSAEAAKVGQTFQRAVKPFEQFFAMNNQPPQKTMHDILSTASVLQMGAPAQKAQMVAQLIKQFGVDIKTLDNVLVGQAPPPEVQQQSEVQQAVQQAVAPYQQTLQQLQQQQQMAHQQAQAQIGSEVDQFAQQAEFYRDVRMEMADILDMAANRGVEMSLQEAYDKACALDPQISKILQARGGADSLAGKRRAASSVRGGPGGDGSSSAASLRGAIEAAWDNAGRM